MSIPAELVKKLREQTGESIMACKKALQVTEGDLEKAFIELRKVGLASAGKKSSRVAAEGAIVIALSEDGATAIILEVNSETDFVARDENFAHYASLVAKSALKYNVDTIEKLPETPLHDNDTTIEQGRHALIAKIGENVVLRRISLIKAQPDHTIGYYIHSNKQIGVLVTLVGGDALLGKNIAMHIAASHPLVVNREDVPEELVKKEREIYTAEAQGSGKPVEIIDKMIEGKVNKFLDEASLLGQSFIKDPGIKVSQLLNNEDAKVLSFIRYKVGEGVERKVDTFVEEVMSQVDHT